MSEEPTFVQPGLADRIPPTTQVWIMDINLTFEADNLEDAEAVARRITERVIEHPAVWNAEGAFDPDQTTETVDD